MASGVGDPGELDCDRGDCRSRHVCVGHSRVGVVSAWEQEERSAADVAAADWPHDDYATFSFLFVAVAEVLRRRRSTTSALQATQRAQATMAREVLESRLAAMQAQVEPQFLFDSLVDIEPCTP